MYPGIEAGWLAGAALPATRADTAPGRETGIELLTEVRGLEKEAEYPVPILGGKDIVVRVMVDRELDEALFKPLRERFSWESLA